MLFQFAKVKMNAFLEDYIKELRMENNQFLEVFFITDNVITALVDRDKHILF
ncbi:hypothetical protein H5P36_01590 [Bacillus sp. APMAM]|nr:hypothetical protein [Bacillus sp. APMAM]